LYDIVLILLLFADDMVIIGKNPEEIQELLDLLYLYCNNCRLKVNTTKTKIMVFRKKGLILPTEQWNLYWPKY
jgi:hypothetical protein